MNNVLLIGTGHMGREYLNVLKALGANVIVVGRDAKKAEILSHEYGVRGFGGGTAAFDKIDLNAVDLTIIATPVDSLGELTQVCFQKGLKKILIEKPGALGTTELERLQAVCPKDTVCGIAYNRRFYNSTQQLRSSIAAEGGALGCFFDFTERQKDILGSNKSVKVMERWGLANSSHVIDLAFFLTGRPVELHSLRSGHMECHPTGATFVGHGRSEVCPFSYFATWAGGGRWNVEVSTAKGRYKMSPLEDLYFCAKDQFSWEKIVSVDEDDQKFKPGLFKMVKAVLLQDAWSDVPTIPQQVALARAVERICGYGQS